MKKLLIYVAILLLFTGCGSSSGEGSIAGQTKETTLQIGEMAETDYVEFTMTKVQFANTLGLEYSNWLRPTNNGGMTCGDEKVYVYIEFVAKNLKTDDLSGFDICNATVRYKGKYNYDDNEFTGTEKFSTDSSTTKNNGLPSMEPLTSREYWGNIECAAEVRENRSDVEILVKLPSSSGEQVFAYKMPEGDSSIDSDKMLGFIDAINEVQGELNFCYKYMKNVPDANYGVADNVYESLRNPLKAIDLDYFESAIPGIKDKINTIQACADKAADLIEDMCAKRSKSNLKDIENTCKEGMDLIADLMDNELSDYQ